MHVTLENLDQTVVRLCACMCLCVLMYLYLCICIYVFVFMYLNLCMCSGYSDSGSSMGEYGSSSECTLTIKDLTVHVTLQNLDQTVVILVVGVVGPRPSENVCWW